MTSADTHRTFARRALVVTIFLVAAAFLFYANRGELGSAIIVLLLLGGWGYAEYQHRQRDLEMLDDGPEADPFEKRERQYDRRRRR